MKALSPLTDIAFDIVSARRYHNRAMELSRKATQTLLELWVRAVDNHGAFTLRDCDPAVLPSWLFPHLRLLSPASGSSGSIRLKYKVIGTNVLESADRQAKGRYVDEFDHGHWACFWNTTVALPVFHNMPSFGVASATFRGRPDKGFEFIFLPVRSQCERIDRVISAVEYFDMRPQMEGFVLSEPPF